MIRLQVRFPNSGEGTRGQPNLPVISATIPASAAAVHESASTAELGNGAASPRDRLPPEPPLAACSMDRASCATVRLSNTARTDISMPNSLHTREINRAAVSECPPRLRKSSWIPTVSSARRSAQSRASLASTVLGGGAG